MKTETHKRLFRNDIQRSTVGKRNDANTQGGQTNNKKQNDTIQAS